jgi:hypothetical protein
MKFRFWVLMSLIVLAACTLRGHRPPPQRLYNRLPRCLSRGCKSRVPQMLRRLPGFLEAWQGRQLRSHVHHADPHHPRPRLRWMSFRTATKRRRSIWSLQRLEFQIPRSPEQSSIGPGGLWGYLPYFPDG